MKLKIIVIGVSVVYWIGCSLAAAAEVDISGGKQFAVGAFSINKQALVIGADDAGATEHALTKIDRNEMIVRVASLAPARTMVNGVDAPNPLHDKKITALALMDDTYPVVAVDGDTKLYLVNNGDHGNSVLVNDTAITDAAGSEIKKPLVAVAASDDYVFAVVSEWDELFGARDGTERGIAVLQKDGDHLKVLDAANDLMTDAGTAARLSVEANKNLLSFVDGVAGRPITKLIFENPAQAKATCVWDDKLNRLFVGMSSLKRDGNKKEGGVLGVVSGKIDANRFVLEPVLKNPAKGMLYDAAAKNVNDRVIGFYYDGLNAVAGGLVKNQGTQDVMLQVPHIVVMHASTGKDYLIVGSSIRSGGGFAVGGGAVGTGGTGAVGGIFALPLDAVHGTVTSLDGRDINDLADMPTAALPGVRIGGEHDATNLADVNQLYVVGDAVYQSTNQDIFQSTALFNAQGFITGWTPFSRVMGAARPVQVSALGQSDGSFYMVTDNAAKQPARGAAVTTWHNDDGELNDVLRQVFAQEKRGVYEIAFFDERTAGFLANQFAMGIAYGYDTVALVQTMQGGNITTRFRLNQEVFPFSNEELHALAPLTSAAVVGQAGPPGQGKVFVAGYGGVAVLADGGGNGWNGGDLAQLQAGAFPGTGFTFQPFMHDVGPVLKVLGNNQYLYVMTKTNVYRQSIFPAGVRQELLLPADATDCVLAGDTIFVGTSKGVYRTNNAFTALQQIVGMHEPVIQLYYLSTTKGFASAEGNLYALVGEMALDQAMIYRFAVTAGNIADPIDHDGGVAKVYKKLPAFRKSFAVDGSQIISTLSRHLDVFDPVRLEQSNTSVINDDDEHMRVGAIVKDSVSGKWFVSGDWGVLVHE